MDLDEIIEVLYEENKDLDFRRDDITGDELKSLNRAISRIDTDIRYAKQDLNNIKNKIENGKNFNSGSTGHIKNGINAKRDALIMHDNISSELDKVHKKLKQYLVKTDKEYIRLYEKTDIIKCIAEAKRLINFVHKLDKASNRGFSNFAFKFKSDTRHLLD